MFQLLEIMTNIGNDHFSIGKSINSIGKWPIEFTVTSYSFQDSNGEKMNYSIHIFV